MYYQNSPIHAINKDIIAQAVHYMSSGHIPAEHYSDTLTQSEAASFVSFTTKTALSPIFNGVAAYLGLTSSTTFTTTTIGKLLTQQLTDIIIHTGNVRLNPPFSRPWLRRIVLIDYIHRVLKFSSQQLTVNQPHLLSTVIRMPASALP